MDGELTFKNQAGDQVYARVDGQNAMTVDQVYAANLGSVVGVNGDVKTNYWGQVVSNPVSGSGFVITKDGYIVTNYHVMRPPPSG